MLGQPRDLARLLFGVTLPVDRKTYALTGFVLMPLKLLGDALILRSQTGRWWPPWSYLNLGELDRFVSQETVIVLTLWALPFAWIGLSMTVRRLLHARRSPWLALLYCLPVVNLVAMLAFCFLSPPAAGAAERAVPEPWGRPSTLGAVFAAFAVTAVAVVVAVTGLQELGWFLFAGTPLAVGFVSGLVGYRPGQAMPTLWIALVAMLFAYGLIVLIAVDGLICLLMALPLAVPLVLVGAVVGYAVREAQAAYRTAASCLAVLVLLPALAALDADRASAPPTLHQVTTEIHVAAEPEEVWPHLIAFDPLPPPRRLLFHLGIAHPTGARIDGSGVGAVRHCQFTTGAFVEPITTWNEPRHLAFDVAEQPPPLSELTPYRHLAIDHSQHGIHTRRGEFRLLPDGNGGTILRGTTWYEIQIAPESYWKLWTGPIIGTIHQRVLEHIANRATGASGEVAVLEETGAR